ncbi:hypothetical protein KBD87_03645 [Candidatus Saccharibacteria bacterium]|nr:hypothetical protein [Candidatus Saccharibacteria bacterium]
MLFILISCGVPLLIAIGLPRIVRTSVGAHEAKYRMLLYAACVAFFVSWYLPSPRIDGQDTSFMTHVLGGGIFTGLLWLYLKKSFTWRAHWSIEVFSLFALVSALGCVNELAELFMVRLHIATILLSDTNWDILANTLGALVLFIAYSIINNLNSTSRDRRR